ncbi:hypothetical protein Ciccas_001757 [Cichlidogyrus casuarinus]|uniref:Uncharacterized protein n=1 Tax=Cichlidogyrus casuarinus TaxID=1844966 RepID=A0ABD2QK68_9PLAT
MHATDSPVNGLTDETEFSEEEELENEGSLGDDSSFPSKCGLCDNNFTDPLILQCLHIYDKECLQKFENKNDIIPSVKCPKCAQLSGPIRTLKKFDASLMQKFSKDDSNNGEVTVTCTECTSEKEALYRCIQCSGTLCEQCRRIHKVMKVFSSHEVLDLSPEERANSKVLFQTMQNSKPRPCNFHSDFVYNEFCIQCAVPTCNQCREVEHKDHIHCDLQIVFQRFESEISQALHLANQKKEELRKLSDDLQISLPDVVSSRDHNKKKIENICAQWISAVNQVKEDLLQENRELHKNLEMNTWQRINNLNKTIDHIDFADDFCERYFKKCSNTDMCELYSTVHSCLSSFGDLKLDSDLSVSRPFYENPESIIDVVKQHFGSFDPIPPETVCKNVDTTLTCITQTSGPPSIINGFPSNGKCNGTHNYELNSDSMKRLSLKTDSEIMFFMNQHNTNPQTTRSIAQISPTGSHSSAGGRSTSLISSHTNNAISGGHHFSLLSADSGQGLSNITNPSPWNTLDTMSSTSHQNGADFDSLDSGLTSSQLIDAHLAQGDASSSAFLKMSKSHNTGLYPNSTLYEYSRQRNARCNQMSLLTKWGSMGCELGRLNSPHGFCLGFDEEIVVADTHNHRIQIFSKRGQFLNFFGVSGRVDGLLWYPRKVAIIRQSQRYVVCDRGSERSRMQLFSRSGHFVRRIAIRYIDIVAGLAINQHG